jgi:hypothetical protein
MSREAALRFLCCFEGCTQALRAEDPASKGCVMRQTGNVKMQQ